MAITKVSRNLLNTGVSDSSDATAITIDSDEKVGVGLTNPADYYSDQLVVSSPSEGGITLASTATSNVNYILFADGTSGDAAYRGQFAYNHSNDLMSIVSSGTMDFRTGSSRTERLRILDGGGITFNGDTAAANALDDYEEGLWTPTIASGGSVTATSARYTKIGNTVRATARLSSFSFTNVDGTHLSIGGLPYSMHSDSNVGFAWGNTGTQGKAIYFWSGSGGGSSAHAYWGGNGYDSTTHNEVPAGFNLILNLVYGHG